jgi:Zn-dependent protease with chaperone function
MNSSYKTMDFFQHQERALAGSRRFVLLYVVAVVLICLAMAALAGGATWFINDSPEYRVESMLIVSGIAAALSAILIVGGSLHRISELRGGGSSVAHSLGGRLIDSSSANQQERRLLNVVEEMAIASGVPVPPVYLMPAENGINAFAAGYSPGDAVIGVTKGCVDGLTRDELQGVMAHEFSHILNGDMRLNIRMIGLLNGIVLISLIGHIVFQTTPRHVRGKEGFALQISWVTLGVLLIIIGSLGALTARIIQSAVSRQREFLADASAVQFTRNPSGIADALRRIGGNPRKARVKHPRSQEAGHMFFGETSGATSMLRATLASHPPLKERIKRIDPSWDGTMLEPLNPVEPVESKSETTSERMRRMMTGVSTSGELDASGTDGSMGSMGSAATLLPMLALSGTMTPAHIEHARSLINSIPKQLRDAAHDAYSGRAVVYALLLDRKDVRIHESQINHLQQNGDPNIAKLVEKLSTSASTMPPDLRLPLLDMTLGSLAQLTDKQHLIFRANVDALVKMDKSIDLFEWVTAGVLTRHLDERFGNHANPVTQYYSLKQLGREVSVLLSSLAYAGADDNYAASEAILMGESALPGLDTGLLSKQESSLTELNKALNALSTCAGRLKGDLLRACALVVAADNEVTISEAELLRAIADALGVPTPPLLPGQKFLETE